jgi:hypothetical protein
MYQRAPTSSCNQSQQAGARAVAAVEYSTKLRSSTRAQKLVHGVSNMHKIHSLK